jgi:hypothetical protein
VGRILREHPVLAQHRQELLRRPPRQCAVQGIRFLTKNHGAVISAEKINKVTALHMLGPQPGPATLFLFGLTSSAAR